MKGIILFSVIFFIIALIIKFKVVPFSEKIKVFIVLFCTIFTISFNSGYEFLEYNGYSLLRVPIWFLIIVSLGLVNSSIKWSKDDIFIKSILLLLILNTVLWGFNITDVVKYFNFIYLYIGIFFLYEIVASFKRINTQYILNILVIVATLNSILGIFQFIFNKKFLPGVWNESIYFLEETGGVVKRIIGFAGTNNAAGAFGALLFCVVLFVYLKEKKYRYILPLGLSAIFSILTLTRIGYLAILIQIVIFYMFTSTNTKKKLLIKYTIFIIGLIGGVFILINYGVSIYEVLFLNRGYTGNYRITQFDFAIKNVVFDNWLLGVGPGQFNRYLMDVFGKMEIDLHSQYLNVLVEQGIFIFIVFVTFNIILLKKVLNKYKDNLTRCFIWGIFLTSIICFNYNPNQYYMLNNILYYIIMFSLLKCELIKEN